LHIGFAKTHYSLLKSYKNKVWILNWLANPPRTGWPNHSGILTQWLA